MFNSQIDPLSALMILEVTLQKLTDHFLNQNLTKHNITLLSALTHCLSPGRGGGLQGL